MSYLSVCTCLYVLLVAHTCVQVDKDMFTDKRLSLNRSHELVWGDAQAGTRYPVRAPTSHPIHENFRVETFRQLLQPGNGGPSQMAALGELMYQVGRHLILFLGTSEALLLLADCFNIEYNAPTSNPHFFTFGFSLPVAQCRCVHAQGCRRQVRACCSPGP
jgi:hypothetical protein